MDNEGVAAGTTTANILDDSYKYLKTCLRAAS